MIVKSNGSFAALILNIVSVAGACLCYAGCGEGRGAHCVDTIREYDWASIKSIKTHLWGPPRHSATVPSGRTVSYFYQQIDRYIDNPSL